MKECKGWVYLRWCESATQVMAKPSISMPDELLESFDKTLNEMKKSGDIEMDTRRSEVVRELMREWIEENREVEEGNCQSTAVMMGS